MPRIRESLQDNNTWVSYWWHNYVYRHQFEVSWIDKPHLRLIYWKLWRNQCLSFSNWSLNFDYYLQMAKICFEILSMSKKRISNIEFTMSLQNYDLIAYQRKNNLMNERFLFDCFSFFTNGARQVLCKKKI